MASKVKYLALLLVCLLLVGAKGCGSSSNTNAPDTGTSGSDEADELGSDDQFDTTVTTEDNTTETAESTSEGSQTSGSTTYDTTPPVTTINTKLSDPSKTPDPSFSFSANETATFQCAIDGGVYQACSSPVYYTGLYEGTHTFYVKATDTPGNTSTESFSWSIFWHDFGWTKTFGGSGTDSGNSVSIDSNNNIFITGSFQNTVDFDFTTGTDNHTANGARADIFITKINSDGSYGWTKTFGGSSADGGFSLSIDSNNNIFVTGYFADTVDFDFTTGTDNHTSNGASDDTFITKINPDGSYGWTKTFGGSGIEAGNSLSIDSNNNIFITGSFQNTVDFDFTTGTDNHTSNGKEDTFITKINSDGSYGWTKTFGGSDTDRGRSLSIDSNNNIFVAGYFFGTDVDFDFTGGTDNNSSNGHDIFITKINSDGSYGWTKTFGGSNTELGYSVSADSNNNIFVTGQFIDTVDFDFTTGTDNHTTNGASADTFVTKINSDGSYGWTKTFGGSDTDLGNSLSIDSNNNVFFTGFFRNTVDFDFTTGTDNHTSNGSNDTFVTKINSDGSYGWTKTFGGSGSDSGNSLSIDSNNNIFVTGHFADTVDFDFTTGTDNHTSNEETETDAFVIKIKFDQE